MKVECLTANEWQSMRRAGRIAADTLAWVGTQLCAGMTTETIDQLVRRDTARRGASPSQLGYRGFSKAVCTSVNHVVCHGIPSPHERLKPGDIINVDVTSCVDGYHGDTSRTFFIGSPSEPVRHLVRVTERCLYAGIAAVRHGARLGDIGAAIEAVAHAAGCSVVREFGGHGIGRSMHLPPHVAHFGERGTGRRLRTGMAITIEPMINLGRPEVRVLDDGWTVVTLDGSPSAQFEHTIIVTPDGAEIVTLPTDAQAQGVVG